MSRFKIGQRVVCVDARVNPSVCGSVSLIQGAEYIVDGFTCCAGCGESCIFLTAFNGLCSHYCGICGASAMQGREWCRESRFEPLSEISDAISELMKETNLITN